jgi:diguanylate cyclase (GGDEF)-like protein/PAS domain S-box-containing protein
MEAAMYESNQERRKTGQPFEALDSLSFTIAEGMEAARELQRTNRALRLLSLCDEIVIRAEDEIPLLVQVCTLAVEQGGYLMAGVAYALDDGARSLLPVAHAGPHADDYFSQVRLSWSDSDAYGKGPTGQTVRTGKSAVVADLTHAASHSPCLAAALRFGAGGVVTLPLRDDQRTFGVLALYTAAPIVAAATELQLLRKMASDLAFGIRAVRARNERQRIQDAALKIAAAVSAPSGENFFRHLIPAVIEALRAHAGFIARPSEERPDTMRTICAAAGGRDVADFDYAVAAAGEASHRLFPPSDMITACGAQVCLGRNLYDSSGRCLGFLAVLFARPVEDSGFVASAMQIFAARAAAELEREEAVAHIRQQAELLDKAHDAIVVRDMENRVRFWNKGAERLYGWTAKEMLGRSVEELLYRDPKPLREATATVMEKGEWRGEIVELHKNGTELIVEGNWTLVRDEHGKPRAIFAIKTDITRRKAAEREIQQLAFYDPLTHLPNRRLLLDRLQRALVACARGTHCGALFFIDLDNFKILNDSLGHDKGDMLLQQVAQRLVSCVRADDTVARLGGDEFVVMLEGLSATVAEAEQQAKTVGEKILAAFTPPFELDEHEHRCTPSVGVTLFTGGGASVEELLKQADLAMYEAKSAGRNGLRFFKAIKEG